MLLIKPLELKYEEQIKKEENSDEIKKTHKWVVTGTMFVILGLALYYEHNSKKEKVLVENSVPVEESNSQADNSNEPESTKEKATSKDEQSSSSSQSNSQADNSNEPKLEPKIKKIIDSKCGVKQGEDYFLPPQVVAILTDDTEKLVDVKWTKSDKVNTDEIGQYSYYGKVDGFSGEAEFILDVISISNKEFIVTNISSGEYAKFTMNSDKLIVDGIEQPMDGAPYNENGYMMVPIRDAYNALEHVTKMGIPFDANRDDSRLFSAGSNKVTIKIGSKLATVNGIEVEIMVVPVMQNKKLYVSISEICLLLGMQLSCDAETESAFFVNE